MGIIDEAREELKRANTSEIAKREDLDIPLYVAIYNGDLKALNAAIESGANVNSQGCASDKKEHRFITNFSPLQSVYNETCKHARAFSKSKRDKLVDIDTCFSLADSLIAAGADTKPLLRSVIGRDTKWAHYLLGKTKDLNGLLHRAVEVRDSLMLFYLLRRGADVNEIFYGNSPLHEAVKRDDFQMTRELLEAGASLTQKNRNNLTAFDIAIENNHLKLATYLTKQLNCSSWEDSAHRVQVDISNQLFRIANLIEIYLHTNALQYEEDEEEGEDEDYE